MKKLISRASFLLRHKDYILLILILATGLFLRAFKLFETFGFSHDADLFSWMVKDILIDKHLRLIGQETSTIGIFIGPLFYYFLTPFYLITGFHPTSAIYAALIIGVLTIFSYFFIFRKLFDNTTGLIAAFMQAAWPSRVTFDRWIVPTITVNLWCIWYLFSIFMLARGNLNYLALAGLMSGLIWHVHVALAPLLILIPLAVFFARKKPSLKQMTWFFGAFFVPMLPFFVFEIRHGFTQTSSFFLSFLDSPENIYGSSKIDDVIVKSLGENFILNFGLLLGALLLPKLKVIGYKFLILIYVWILSVVAFFTISKKIISEYYFENIRTVILILLILFLSLLIKSKNIWFKILGLVVLLILLINSVQMIYKIAIPGNGFVARQKVVEYIKQDATSKQYPCISVSHISTHGEDFGYRYLFWYNGLKMAKGEAGIPNYTIVFPFSLATESAKFRYAALNVIPPEKDYNLEQVNQLCPQKDYNLTAPFWGFTN